MYVGQELLISQTPAWQVLRAHQAQKVSAAQLTVPLAVDVGVGTNWDEAH